MGKNPVGYDELITVLDDEHARAVIEHRKAMGKAGKLTAYAAKLLAKHLSFFPDPNAAADEMILRGWRIIKTEWVAKPQAKQPATPQASGGAPQSFDYGPLPEHVARRIVLPDNHFSKRWQGKQ